MSVMRAFLFSVSACLSLSSVLCFVCLGRLLLVPFLDKKTLCLGYC